MPVRRWLRGLRNRAERSCQAAVASPRSAAGSGTTTSGYVGLENLEPRLMLNSLVGGDVFIFQNADGLYADGSEKIIRITTTGNLLVEVIGVTLDENNQPLFAPIPGKFLASDVGRTGLDVNGGVGGRDGVEPVTLDNANGAPTDIVDPLAPADLNRNIPAPSALNTLEALASNAAGDTYAFNVTTITELVEDPDNPGQFLDVERALVQLIQLDNATGEGTVVAELSDMDLDNDGTPDLMDGLDTTQAIRAADFDPVSGLLYFVADLRTQVTAEETHDFDRLFSVDVNAGTRDDIRASVVAVPGSFGDTPETPRSVNSITFDQTGAAASVMYVVYEEGDAAQDFIATVNNFAAGTNALANVQAITTQGANATGITGIALVDDNPAAAEVYVYAVDADTDNLLRLTRGSGRALVLGSLPDPDDGNAGNGIRGADLASLTWNPTLTNPFTGEAGVLLATDKTTDDLLFIDDSFRFPFMNAFALYVAQADANAGISIARASGEKIDSGVTPFTGSTGDFRVANLQGGDGLIVVSASDETGEALLGIKTFKLDGEEGQNSDLIPIIDAALGEYGLRPANYQDAQDLDAEGQPTGQNLTSGLVVTDQLLEFLDSDLSIGEQLLGSDFDNVQGLSVSRDGIVVAVNTTVGSDDQLGIVSDAGFVGSVVTVTGQEGVRGLDFGDLDFDGVDELFAVYESAGTQTLGTIDVDTGTFTAVGALSGAIGDVRAISFSPDQRLYLVDAASTLYEIDPTDASLIATIGHVTGDTDFGSSPVVLNIDDFDINALGIAVAHDRDNGRVVDIDLSTAAAGTLLATTQGTMRPTVGAIAYDFANDRFLAVDNVTASPTGTGGSGILMQMLGGATPTQAAQDLGSFLLGGTITGHVDVSGSMDLFYAGWIITGLTTGQVSGSTLDTTPSRPGNFNIGGDLRDLITLDSLGTDTEAGDGSSMVYVSGTDVVVNGRLGQLYSRESIAAHVKVTNSPFLLGQMLLDLSNQDNPDLSDPSQRERETSAAFSGESAGAIFERMRLPKSVFSNDTADTAQYLGTIATGQGTPTNEVQLGGSLIEAPGITDLVDNYRIGLMAGETLAIRLLTLNPFYTVRLGLFDPDGRLVATNYSDHYDLSAQEYFQFTPDRPGIYRLAMARDGDTNFNGAADDTLGTSPLPGKVPYLLSITGLDDIALGAVVADENIFGSSNVAIVGVTSGDLGAVKAGGAINYFNFPPPFGPSSDVVLNSGNLRAIEADQIGQDPDSSQGILRSLAFNLTNGDVGLVRSLTGTMNLMGGFVGGSIQMVDSAGQALMRLFATEAIGTIRAASLDSLQASSTFNVNTDDSGNDGVIDLIDVAGDFGTGTNGGPIIDTGLGGNVRYINVPEGAEVWTNTQFGVAQIQAITFSPGESINIVDDSGGQITVAPGSGTLEDGLIGAGSLTWLGYGIPGSGGSVTIRLTSSAGGMNITGSGVANNQPVDITNLILNGSGRDVTLDANGLPVIATTGDNLSVAITGNRPVDILSVQGGNIVNITNNTRGEVVNVVADSVGNLSAHTIGLAKSATGAAVLPRTTIAGGDAYPFLGQKIGVVVAGDLVSARARAGIGNLLIGGSVREIIANDNVNDIPGENLAAIEGVVAPLFITGTVGLVNIGEGLTYSGNGEVALSGIYAQGVIRRVVNQSNGPVAGGSDIRGDIVSQTAIDEIALVNGSIINADILVPSDIGDSREISGGAIYLDQPGGTVSSPTLEIGSISVSGTGGILGTRIFAFDVGNVTVGSFGLLATDIETVGEGRIGNITAGGYGIRLVTLQAGSDTGNITATGTGQPIALGSFSRSSQFSTNYTFDPISGLPLDFANDLSIFMQTTSTFSAGLIGGVIDQITATGNRNLGTVKAYNILSTNPFLPSVINYANAIAGIQTLAGIERSTITTGRLGSLRAGDSVTDSSFQIAGPLGPVSITGDLSGGSSLAATGPSGTIASLNITGDLIGSVLANVSIGTVTIGGDMVGALTINGAGLTGTQRALTRMTLGGSFTPTQDVVIDGNAGTIEARRSLGAPGQQLLVQGHLQSLIVGSDRDHDGAQLNLTVRVLGDLNSAMITGELNGNLEVQGNLGSLTVTADPASLDDILTGDLRVGGNATTVRVTDGNVTGLITVLRELGTFTLMDGDLEGALLAVSNIRSLAITNGSITPTGSVSSTLGDIASVSVRNGDIQGSVSAPRGTINSITITGSDLGDGVNPLSIVAAALNTLNVAGSIFDGVTITVTGLLRSASVGGSIADGASITAGSLGTLNVTGSAAGDITAGYNASGTTLTVRGSLGGAGSDISINADTTVNITGSLLAGTTLGVGQNLRSLTAADIAGDLLVDLSAARISAASLSGANVIAGMDITTLAVTGAVVASLVQVGASRVAATGEYDAGKRRQGRLGSFSANSVAQSIIASGGDVGSANVRTTVLDSSLSSGLVLQGGAIDDILAGVLDLTLMADRDAARVDATLLRGNMGPVSFVTATGSSITAGVAPGAAGDWSVPTLLDSVTGGDSRITSLRGAIGAGSRVFSDAPITSNSATLAGGTIVSGLTYSVTAGDLSTVVPLETLVGTAVSGTPLVYTTLSGDTLTITISGPGSVQLRDEAGVDTDNLVDTLVLLGTTSATTVTITTSTPGDVGIGRVLGADDAPLGTFRFDGDLLGVAGDIGLWIDGPINTFSVRDIGEGLFGQIGGSVATMTLRNLGDARLVVGGAVTNLTIASGSATSIFALGAAAPTGDVTRMAVDSAGNLWVFDSVAGTITRVDPDTGAVLSGPLSVTDAATGDGLTLTGIDFDASDDLWAVASVADYAPVIDVGAILPGAVLATLAQNDAGLTVAIDSSTGFDRLISINPDTGVATVLGEVRTVFNQKFTGDFLALAFSAETGKLYGLVSDRDGGGAEAPSVALVELETSDANNDGVIRATNFTNATFPGVRLDGGGVTSDYSAMFVRDDGDGNDNNDLFLIRRNGAADELVQLTLAGTGAAATATQSLVGTVQVGGSDTTIIGAGFDALGTVIALTNDGVTAQMIAFDVAAPGAGQALDAGGVVSTDLDVFALGQTGSVRAALAYDADAAGGQLFRSAGEAVQTLFMVDTLTGEATRVAQLSADAAGTPLTTNVRGLAIDTVGLGHAFVVDASGRLFEFDLTAPVDGLPQGGAARGVVSNGAEALDILDIDFDSASGQLLGLDAVLGTVVSIDATNAVAVTLFERGTVNTNNVVAFAYDPADAVLRAFDTDADALGTFNAALAGPFSSGLTAVSLGTVRITGGDDFAGRIEATGNTIGSVTVTGDFTGTLATLTSIASFTQTGGDFAGRLLAGQNLQRFALTGDVLVTGLLSAGLGLPSVVISGVFAGQLTALTLGTFTAGSVSSGGNLSVTREAGAVTSTGDFAGGADLGLASTFTVRGLLSASAGVVLGGAARNVTITGGTAAGSSLQVNRLTTLNVGGTHMGLIHSFGNVDTATFATVTDGVLAIGRDARTLNVTGDATNALFSIGVWIGQDGVYNTADDVIFGGSLTTATFSRDYIDSVLAAGVLPNVVFGPGVPTDLRAFIGNAAAAQISATDSADAGGAFRSALGTVNLRGLITSSAADRPALLTAADSVGRVTGPQLQNLTTRQYGDPLGAPTVLSAELINDGLIRFVFSEQLNSAAFTVSVDGNGDGDLNDASDTQGTVTIASSLGQIVSDVTLSYSTLTDVGGNDRGVLLVSRTNPGFVGLDPEVTLSGDLGLPAIYDRSGLRSIDRDLNLDGVNDVGEDVRGTILDGDAAIVPDGAEGGDFTAVFSVGDAPGIFVGTPPQAIDADPLTVVLDGPTRLVFGEIGDNVDGSPFDADLYRVDGLSGQYLAIDVDPVSGSSLPSNVQLGLFLRDDQGTLTTTDDTFELVARHENSEGFDPDADLFAAFELPEAGEYYIAVVGDGAGQGTTAFGYRLEVTLASSDLALAAELGVALVDGSLQLPAGDQQIAYVNNADNPPKQLVYLNITGGTTTRFTPVEGAEITFTEFVAGDLDSLLTGLEDELFHGGMGVEGVLDKMVSIFLNTSPSHPGGGLTVGQIEDAGDWATFNAAGSGLYFTTMNPAEAIDDGMLPPGTLFTTLFIGDTANEDVEDVFGEANQIDLANLDKADEAILVQGNFNGLSTAVTVEDLLEEYSNIFANIAAHELGHLLGLNHQPTSFFDFILESDDPDNDDLTFADENLGAGLMAYAPTSVLLTQLLQLGTKELTQVEFPLGDIDTQDLLIRWLA